MREAEIFDCPDCGLADMEPYGSKWRCPRCRYVEPCCTTDGPAGE